MKKRMLGLLLVGITIMSVLAGCSTKTSDGRSDNTAGTKTADNEDEEPYNITMAYYATPQKGTERVQEAINKQLDKDGMNMTVTLLPIAWGSYEQQITLMLSGGDKLDLFVSMMSNAIPMVKRGQIVDMAPYIEQHSDNIVAAVGEDAVNCAKVNGVLYGVPSTRDTAVERSLVIQKEVADKCGIKQEDVKTMQDLTDVFAKIAEKYPDMIPTKASIMDEMMHTDQLGGGYGVLLNGGADNTNVVNLIETDVYMEYCELVRDWYNKGYVSKDAATESERNEDLLKSGKIASYLSHTKPGYRIQGKEVYVWPIIEAYTTTDTVCSYNWCIANNSENPEKVMEFLNYAYGSPEFNNLIIYGEEGVDYKIIDPEKGMIGFADGITPDNATYNDDIAWEMPNESIAYLWEGAQEGIWNQIRDFNLNAVKSKAYGFAFDETPVANEMAALRNVSDKYHNVLQTGAVDPKKTVPKYLKELKAAGVEKVVAEKQKQLDEWLANKE